MAYRWQRISDALRQAIEAGDLKPGDRLPPDVQLAVQYRVSKMTVHRAMGELQQAGFIERKRRSGSIVRDGVRRPVRRSDDRGWRVAMLIFRAHDFPQASYLGGFRDALPDDCELLLCDTGSEPMREIAHLERLRGSVDGIACLPSGDPATTARLAELIAEGMPVVCLDRLPDALDADAVFTDNYGSTRAALQYLTGRGHRRIGFVTTDNFGISSVQERREAFRETLAAVGCLDSESLTAAVPCIANEDFDAFTEQVYRFLSAWFRRTPPDALFCLEDYCLAAALEACERLGVAVGRDIEIAAYSDIPSLSLRGSRQVHRLVQRAREMGQMGAERLLRRMAGDDLPTAIFRVEAAFHPARAALPAVPALLAT
jgi:DNA-binding LacI/PurR family transcriptional regulator